MHITILGALDGWDPSTASVSCDVLCHNYRVRDLCLPRLQLGGQLSDSFSRLTQLRRLSLDSDNLNGHVLPSLSNCFFLHTVYLHNNSLSGHLPPPLLSLTNLQVLNLAHNLLSVNLTISLRYLDLSSNAASSDISANFSLKSQLQFIKLYFDGFTGGIPVTVKALKNLEYLWLDSNNLHGTLISEDASITRLLVIQGRGGGRGTDDRISGGEGIGVDG